MFYKGNFCQHSTGGLSPVPWNVLSLRLPHPFLLLSSKLPESVIPSLPKSGRVHAMQEVYFTWVWAWKNGCEKEGIGSKDWGERPDQEEYLEQAWKMLQTMPRTLSNLRLFFNCVIFYLQLPWLQWEWKEVVLLKESKSLYNLGLKERSTPPHCPLLPSFRPRMASTEGYMWVSAGNPDSALCELLTKGSPAVTVRGREQKLQPPSALLPLLRSPLPGPDDLYFFLPLVRL